MSSHLYAALGQAIRVRRERLGLSQSALAEHTDMARTTITNIEAGRQNLMMHQFIDIARALRAQPTELLDAVNEVAEERVTSKENDSIDAHVEQLLSKLTVTVRANRG